jgi:hypothetical protein
VQLALINPTWAVVEDISSGGKFITAHPYFNRVDEVKFGFYSYCLSTKVKNLNDVGDGSRSASVLIALPVP